MTGARQNYVTEVDAVDANSWHAMLEDFADATWYQTWAYGAHRWGESKLSHIVLRLDDQIVALAQVTLVSIPLLGTRMAHVRAGPLWQRKGQVADTAHYEAMLAALDSEYCQRRGLLLRMKPWESAPERQLLEPVRAQSGFRLQAHLPTYDTLILDLSMDIDTIHRGLAQRWRRDLRHSRTHGMTTRCSRDPQDLARYLDIYAAMQASRPFTDYSDIKLIKAVFADLPDRLRPVVMLCAKDGQDVAGIVVTILGQRGFALFGASTDTGKELGASYFSNWAMLEWLKANTDCHWYDLVGGLSNPGIRHFKFGLAKGCGQELHMHDYDLGGSLLTRLIVRIGEQLRPLLDGRRY